MQFIRELFLHEPPTPKTAVSHFIKDLKRLGIPEYQNDEFNAGERGWGRYMMYLEWDTADGFPCVRAGDGGYEDVHADTQELNPKKTNARKVYIKTRSRHIDRKPDFLTEHLTEMQHFQKRECKIWIELARGHPNLTPIIGFIRNYGNAEDWPSLVLPRSSSANLREYLSSAGAMKPPKTLDETLKLLRDVATGLEFLHSKGIAFRDLGTKYILVDENKVARLCNFGATKYSLGGPAEHVLYDQWIPPEYFDLGNTEFETEDIIDATGHRNAVGSYVYPTAAGDIWSYGCLFYDAIFNQKPYGSEDPMKYIEAGMSPPRPTLLDADEYPFFDAIWHFLQQFCWKNDPMERQSVTQIMLMLNLLITSNATHPSMEKEMKACILVFYHKLPKQGVSNKLTAFGYRGKGWSDVPLGKRAEVVLQ